ncbi:MAG: hypothetical protein DMF77_18420 [Acidobacteria bacterium]|nr:MAG: hypothetical protein DMF77_18420 [Acidobacteriota bacterium]
MAEPDDDPIRGKTHRWTFTDGPTAGKTYEHTFNKNGTVAFKEVGGAAAGESTAKKKPAKKGAKPKKPDRPRYASLRAADEVNAVHGLVGFASNDKEWYPLKGTFELVP